MAEIRIYTSVEGSMDLHYIRGVLVSIFIAREDKIPVDALRHKIELYEQDLPKNLFSLTKTLTYEAKTKV